MQACEPEAKLAAPKRSPKVWVRVSRQPSPSGLSSQRSWSSPQVKAKTWGGSSSVITPSMSGASPAGEDEAHPAPGLEVHRTSEGNQSASSAGSVRACQTFSGEWAIRRSRRRAERPPPVG